MKKIKRNRKGNVLIPVIGTIAALTLLGGSAVAYALNSNKIVYKEIRVEQSNSSRNILYICTTYFCNAINGLDGVEKQTAAQAKATLVSTFDLLQITKSTTGEEVYWLWYPINGTDGTDGYYRATVKRTASGEGDGEGNPDGNVNNTLFPETEGTTDREKSKIDTRYNIANMAAVYLKDQNQFSGESLSFDDAFLSQFGKSELLVDNIKVMLCGDSTYNKNGGIYVTGDMPTSAVFETGQLGGHYVVTNTTGNSDGTNTKVNFTDNTLYYKTYDNQDLKGLIEYFNPDINVNVESIKDDYDKASETHIISFKLFGDNRVTYYFTNSNKTATSGTQAQLKIKSVDLASKLYTYLTNGFDASSISYNTIKSDSRLVDMFKNAFQTEKEASGSYDKVVITYNQAEYHDYDQTYFIAARVDYYRLTKNGKSYDLVNTDYYTTRTFSLSEMTKYYMNANGIEIPDEIAPNTTLKEILNTTKNMENESRAINVISSVLEYYLEHFYKDSQGNSYTFSDGLFYGLRESGYEADLRQYNGKYYLDLQVNFWIKKENSDGTITTIETQKTITFHLLLETENQAYIDNNGTSSLFGSKTNVDQILNQKAPITSLVNESSYSTQLGVTTININGLSYYLTEDITKTYNVSSNVYYTDNLTLTTYDQTINVADGATLYVDGDLTLTKHQRVILGDQSQLIINGNLIIDYVDTNYGVDILAGSNSKIFVNGNLEYRGVITNANPSFKDNDNCTINSSTGEYVHKLGTDIRCKLQGVYLINGDVHFKNVNNTTSDLGSPLSGKYYSNPLVNATFYCDGEFDMEGLEASSLYDLCRPTFIFARSVKQPLYSIYSCFSNKNYQGQHTTKGWNLGYVFIILEDSVNLLSNSSDGSANFAKLNMLTPYRNLLSSLESKNITGHNGKVTDEWIDKEEFGGKYTKDMVQEWGLSSILKTGFSEILDSVDGPNSYGIANEVTGDPNV